MFEHDPGLAGSTFSGVLLGATEQDQFVFPPGTKPDSIRSYFGMVVPHHRDRIRASLYLYMCAFRGLLVQFIWASVRFADEGLSISAYTFVDFPEQSCYVTIEKESSRFPMAQSQQPENKNRSTPSLPERATGYKQEVEKVVREVGEHPLYELKRSCSFRNLAEKIEFVKDIQSIATSHIQTEKFLVIGADGATKTFHAVHNMNEFDEAAVRQLLEKYLSPVPDFELFQMTSSDGCPFVLFVVPKQKRRRILAKVTVEDSTDAKSKIVLREGDLWTKGTSTGKRLAKPEDWDEIYEEVIETETERRTRQRTAHALEMATAREKVRLSYGQSSLPSFFTDEEFPALMENLCSAQDGPRFNVLLERLRDDLVEGWHQIGAYEESPALLANPAASLLGLRERVRENIKNVFRPAMHWLTLAGIYVVKNSGPVAFLDAVADLLKEVFDTSHQLVMARSLTPLGATSPSADEHVSHTVPALESLVSLHLIGAYLTKRKRFQYLRSLFRPDVYPAGQRLSEQERKTLMAFWPLGLGCGEPAELQYRAGKINHCAKRIETDLSYLHLFGSGTTATGALCQYELCLELNSHVAMPSDDTQESSAYVAKMYPEMYFTFWPSLIAFPLEYIHGLALTLFSEIKKAKPDLLKLILFDSAFVGFLTRPGSDMVFARFLSGLASNQAQLHMEMRRFPSMQFWPKELDAAIKQSRRNKT
ncbi:MAG: hypothetical protein DMG48_03000 [Acidobacteria bacterium]|nr:MAG: hypothetical protein DMG48_03000 [Acidobacteriota bacterium]